MTAEEESNTQASEEIEYNTIAELTPRMSNVNLTFKVVGKSEAREVTSRKDNETHRIVDATVGDNTGTVIISLWDDAIDKFEVGKSYTLKNAYTGLFRGKLRLKIGNESVIAEAEEPVEEVNLDNDLSEIDHGYSRPRRSQGYGGGYGGSRDRSYGRRDRSYGRRDRRRRY